MASELPWVAFKFVFLLLADYDAVVLWAEYCDVLKCRMWSCKEMTLLTVIDSLLY